MVVWRATESRFFCADARLGFTYVFYSLVDGASTQVYNINHSKKRIDRQGWVTEVSDCSACLQM